MIFIQFNLYIPHIYTELKRFLCINYAHNKLRKLICQPLFDLLKRDTESIQIFPYLKTQISVKSISQIFK